MKLITAYPLVQ